MTNQIKSLGDELPVELSRCRELLSAYKEIGLPGAWAAQNLEVLLSETDKAMVSGDTVAMIRCYQKLKECN